MMPSHPRLPAVAATLSVLSIIAVAILLAYPAPASWAEAPFLYHNDGLWNLFVIKTVIGTGWYTGNPHLGAPFGATFLDFAKPETLHLLLIRALGAFSDNIFLIHNLFYLSGYLAVAVTALWALRTAVGLSWPLAVAGAVLFSWLPYHQFRLGHLFLSSYYAVPVAIWLIVTVAHRPLPATPATFWLKRPGIWLAAAIVASTSIYYAYCAIALLLAAGGIAAIREGSGRRLGGALMVGCMVSMVVMVNLLPSLTHRLERGSNPEVAQRGLDDIERYALSPIMMVLPSERHRIGVLAEPARRHIEAVRVAIENRGISLGLLGTAGFAYLLTRLLCGRRCGAAPLLGTFARLNAVALALGVAGGLSALVGLALSPQFRAMNRISVFIAFFSLASLLLLLQQWLAGGQRWRGWVPVITAAIIGGGLWEQTIVNRVPDPAVAARRLDSDRTYVRAIEAALPAGAAVYQMPYVPFPESPPRHAESLYAHLTGFLHSRQLRWSHGAFKGRPEELWHRVVAQRPLPEQLALIAGAGFAGISVNRLAMADGGAEIAARLRELGLQPAAESPEQDLVFYPLRPSGNRPARLTLPVLWSSGFHGPETDGSHHWAWSREDATLLAQFVAPSPTATPRLSFGLTSLIERDVIVTVDSRPVLDFRLAAGERRDVDIPLDGASTRAVVGLASPQPAQRASKTDSRRVALMVSNPTVTP